MLNVSGNLVFVPDQTRFVTGREIEVRTQFALIKGVVQENCGPLVHCYDQCLRLTSLVFQDGQPAPKDFGNWIEAQREINYSKDQNRVPVWGILIKTDSVWKIEICLQMELCW